MVAQGPVFSAGSGSRWLAAGKRSPARIGLKTCAVSRCQFAQACEHGVMATGARVAERAATKRREARAEQHRGINQIGIRNYTLPQAGDTLIYQYQHQAVGEVRRWRAGASVRLDGFAVAPGIEARAALATQLFGGQQFIQPLD